MVSGPTWDCNGGVVEEEGKAKGYGCKGVRCELGWGGEWGLDLTIHDILLNGSLGWLM